MKDIVDLVENFLSYYNNPENLKNRSKRQNTNLIDLYDNNQFNELIKSGPKLARCTINYPFEKSYTFGVLIDTQKHVIEQIWGQLTYMFSTVVRDSEIPGLYNRFLYSERFGKSYHCIGDLVPEFLEYDKTKDEVIISIGS